MLVLSVCPLVCWWYAVDILCLVPNASRKYCMNCAVNVEPQSDMMSSGIPWAAMTWLMNKETVPVTSTSLLVSAKCTILVNQSTTTRITVKDSDRGSCMMKSMDTDDQGVSGIGKDWSNPYGFCHDVLFHRQVSQVLTYSLTNDLNLGHS